MSVVNKYEDMSAIHALKLVRNKNMLLPDIQREYVWDYPEIEQLFESIVDNYPIGSCIIWKTNKRVLNETKPNLYYFLSNFVRDKSKNEKAPDIFVDEDNYYIVLDGQQRITSLNIALFGSYTSYRGGRGFAWNNPNSWIKRELFYNLDFYARDEDDDESENPAKRFAFLSEDARNNGNWYKVNQLLTYESSQELMKSLLRSNYDDEVVNDLFSLYERLFDSTNNSLIHYYSINEENYDKALDIFVRVNSTGRKLSKSDLIFSTLIDGWHEGKESIEKLLESINSRGDGFKFTRDYLIRLSLVLAGANPNLKIQSLTKETVLFIRNNWSDINTAVEKMVDSLVTVGISGETLSSYNATMPIAYYFFKGGSIRDNENKKELKKFLLVSMAKSLFGVASNTALSSTRRALDSIDCKKTPFTLNIFKDVVLTGGRTFTVTEADIDYWLDTFEKGINTYVLLTLLYPNLKLNQMSFHQDHCHPFVGFENKVIKELNLPEEKMIEWRSKRNLLPNLQFLEGRENESKNQKALIDWVNAGNSVDYIPDGLSLEFKDFEEFFAVRRGLMKNRLMEIFEC